MKAPSLARWRDGTAPAAGGGVELAVVLRVMRLTRGERPTVVLVAALGLLSAGLEVAGLSLLIPLSSLAVYGGDPLELPVVGRMLEMLAPWAAPGPGPVIAIAVAAMLAGILTGWANSVVSTHLAMRAGDDLRRRVFETALRRPVAEVEAMPDGRLTNTLATETWRVGDALFSAIGAFVQGLTCLVFLAALLALSPALTAALVALSATTALVVHLATRAVRAVGQRAVDANEAFMAGLWDALGGLRLIRAYAREDLARARFATRSAAVRRAFIRLGTISAAITPITQGMTILTVAALLGFALWRGDPVEMMAGFLAIAYRMQPRLSAVLRARTALRGFDGATAAVAEAIAAAEAAAGAAGDDPAPPARIRRLVLEGVTAGWPNSPAPALRGIDCEFRGGEITALVGASGAGKSTLAALLLGFLSPASGRIIADGTPVRPALSPAWRARLGFVDQQAHLFAGDIAGNIRFGAPDADDDAVRAAARAADAARFIESLPQGYATDPVERRLSSGQKQRVALARALARAPAVLVLDEATNALDLPSERAVGPALRRLADAGCVVVVIAHRREAIAMADRAVVLQDGRIVEAGAPAALLATDGVFARLYGALEPDSGEAA